MSTRASRSHEYFQTMPNNDPLQNARLSFQCPMDWNAMRGDETKRFCEQCQRYVHNLIEYSEEEARRIICGGNVCVRMTKDAHGRVLTKRSAAAALLVAASVSCQTGYDKNGNPIQATDPNDRILHLPDTYTVVLGTPPPNPNVGTRGPGPVHGRGPGGAP
jgi:hypothetical protein